jgi:hypothetical protein
MEMIWFETDEKKWTKFRAEVEKTVQHVSRKIGMLDETYDNLAEQCKQLAERRKVLEELGTVKESLTGISLENKVLNDVICVYRMGLANQIPLMVVDKQAEHIAGRIKWHIPENDYARDVHGEDREREELRDEADASATSGRVDADRRGGGHESVTPPWKRKKSPLPQSE